MSPSNTAARVCVCVWVWRLRATQKPQITLSRCDMSRRSGVAAFSLRFRLTVEGAELL